MNKLLILLTVFIAIMAFSSTVLAGDDIFSVNFYAYGGGVPVEYRDIVTMEEGEFAGVGQWLTTGWENIVVPWHPNKPQNPVTITGTQGDTAIFTLVDARNGGPYSSALHTNPPGDDNNDMMDGHANGTDVPTDNGSNIFDMTVSNINNLAVYDVIIYLGGNKAQFYDGTGKIFFNGAQQHFKLINGFGGTFTEIVDSTTPGNYIVYEGVTGSSFSVQIAGNDFHHLGPTGFQFAASSGSAAPTVPNVVDMTQTAAQNEILAKGFTVGDVTTDYSDTVSEGDVISQGPAAGIYIPAGSPVDLVVSLGPPMMVDLPNVVNKTQAAAESTLAAVGSPVDMVTTDYSLTFPAGYVISQDPAAGTSVPEGTSVDLVVSLGENMTNIFSVNFYKDDTDGNLTMEEHQAAGMDDWLTTGWSNLAMLHGTEGGLPAMDITSNAGSTAIFDLISARNGGPYAGVRTTLLGDGNADMMDGHVNATESPYDGSVIFNIEVSEITLPVYDVIIYMGGRYGNNKGKYIFNDGPVQSFKAMTSRFDGTFIEVVDDTAGGNYILFENVTGTSFTVQIWGNAFNHIGPCGFQFGVLDISAPSVNAGSDWITWSEEPVIIDNVTAIDNDLDAEDMELTWSAGPVDDVTVGFSNIHAKEPIVTITKDILTGTVTPVELTLTATQPGKETKVSSITIDVYDNACEAGKAADKITIARTDFNANCVTGIEDLARMAAGWLFDFTLEDPVDKP